MHVRAVRYVRTYFRTRDGRAVNLEALDAAGVRTLPQLIALADALDLRLLELLPRLGMSEPDQL